MISGLIEFVSGAYFQRDPSLREINVSQLVAVRITLQLRVQRLVH